MNTEYISEIIELSFRIMVNSHNPTAQTDSKKLYATISADIVASTSLSFEDLRRLTMGIKDLLEMLEFKYSGFWGRIVKGDSIECVMDNPQEALRIALMLKTLVKSFVPYDDRVDGRFKRQGLRMAIGIGQMRHVDQKDDIMDGEAIYLSGRALTKMRNKPIDFFQVVLDKDYDDDNISNSISIIASMLDRQINEATSRQCETLFYRLQFDRDIDVAKVMGISRAGVNSNLRSIGWDLILCALQNFSTNVYCIAVKRKREKVTKPRINRERQKPFLLICEHDDYLRNLKNIKIVWSFRKTRGGY